MKGFYKAEDDALFAAIKRFEEKNKGIKIELSQYPIQDMIPKTVAALDSGAPPDVAYADSYDFQVTAKWAFDGKLEDISSVLGAFALRLKDGKVASVRAAYGGMAATPRRARHVEAALEGRPWNEATVEAGMAALEDDFAPISDWRASAAYRALWDE